MRKHMLIAGLLLLILVCAVSIAPALGDSAALSPELMGEYPWVSGSPEQIDYTVYIGFGMSSSETVWNRGEFINFWLTNFNQLQDEYGGTPTWNLSVNRVSGEDLGYEWHDDGQHVWAKLQSIPETASEATATLTCTWGGQTTTKIIHVRAVQPDFTIPAGITFQGLDADGVYNTQAGQTIVIEPELLPAGNTGVPGCSPAYFCANQLWGFRESYQFLNGAGAQYTIRSDAAGIYTDVVGLGYGPLMITKKVTFRVADATGNVPEPPAPTLENGNSEWTWYTGLGGEWPHNGGLGSDVGIIQLRIPNEYWNGSGNGLPSWTVTNKHTSAAGCYDFTYEVEEWNDGRGISFRPTWTSADETVTGTNTYTVTARYQGQTFESTETVVFTNDSYPTGLMMTVHEADLSTNTKAAQVPCTDGGFTLTEGRDYVFTLNYTGPEPAHNTSDYMNGSLEGALMEYGRYDQRFQTPNGSVWGDNEQVFAALDPGTYDFRPSLSIGMSNLVVIQRYEIRIADVNGNIPGPKLDNSGQVWTYYTGLNDMMQGSVYGLDTLGQFRIPDNERDDSLPAPAWSMEHIGGPDCFELNDNSEHYGGDDINYIRSLSLKGTPATGTAIYRITAAYNYKDYTADVTVSIENPAGVPTGMELRVAEFDESSNTVGQYTTVQSGGELVLRTGTAYVLEGSYVGLWPGDRDNQWLNFDWSEGWEEMNRWQYESAQGNQLFKGFNMVIRGGAPGIYDSGASLSIGMSNLEAYMPLTLKVTDESGNIPTPVLENGNSVWTWYTGLSGEWPHNGGLGSDAGIIQLRIPDQYWHGDGDGSPAWTVTNNHNSAAGCYDFTFEVEEWNGGRGISLRPTWTSADETVTGTNTYTVTAEYQGQTFESTETVVFTSGSYPTGMTMTVHEADLTTNTLGPVVSFTDGAFTLTEGRDYVFTSTYTGTVPAHSNPDYMNGSLDGALMEYGRYDEPFMTENGSVWSDNQQVFAALTPGTYDFQASLSIGMSNLVAIQHYEIRIADANGNVPEPRLELDNSGERWTWYTGLNDMMQGSVYSVDTIGQFRIPDNDRDYSLPDPVWTMEHVSGPDCFEMNDNSEHYGGPDINYIRSLSLKGTPAAGTAEYTMTASYNGKDYTADVIVNIESTTDIPTGMQLRVAEFDEDNETVGQFTTVQSGGELLLQTGTAYVLEGSYVGLWPGDRDNQWLNLDWSEGWEEMDRWQYRDPQGEERFKGYHMVIRGGVPGAYGSGASLTIGMSNLEAFMPFTLKVADENGNVPAIEPEIGGYFSFTEGVDLSETGTYYVMTGLPLDSDQDGVLYSNSNLFTFGVENWGQIRDNFNGTPVFNVSMTSGNITYDIMPWMDDSHIDVYLTGTTVPAAGSAEFRVSCELDGVAYTQTVRIEFVELTSEPTGVEVSWPDPIVRKVGDQIDYNPEIRFANNWTVGNAAWGSYGNGEFWDHVDWDNETWMDAGVYPLQLVARADNISMNATIDLVVTRADGTFPQGDYTPYGTVITLPAAITSIESEAFAGTAITEADIPAGTQIAPDAFADTGLIAVYTHDDPDTIQWAVEHGIVALTAN